MAVQIRDYASAARGVSGIRVRDAASVLRSIKMGKIRETAGTLRAFFTSMTASVSPAEVSANGGAFSGYVSLTTGFATITVVGGTAPFTYAWTFEFGDASVTAQAPAAASCNFHDNVAVGEERNTIFEWVVTDANGSKANGIVSVTMICADYN